jgi:hypothetical protein
MQNIAITVKGPKGGELFKGDVRPYTKVSEFKKLFLEKSEKLKNKKLSVHRVRLTYGEEKNKVALTDKTKPLSFYIKDPEATLHFKDIGPQVSWTTVFLVEYFGPILITLLLIAF